MSIVLTRLSLENIGMNGGATGKRRSARLSGEGNGDNEPPAKKAKVHGSSTVTVATKQQDGEPKKAAGKKKRQEYTDQADDFQFARKGGKRKKAPKDAVLHGNSEDAPAPESAPAAEAEKDTEVRPEPAVEEPLLKAAQKKTRRRLPTTPEREVVEKPTRRSKRISYEKPAEAVEQASPHKSAHPPSRENGDRSPSPGQARPVTVTKKRLQGDEGRRETQVMQIALPFADTPIQRRNKEMRKTSAEGHRRSSSGMRGKRASSVIDEGRGHEVSVSTTGPSSRLEKESSSGSASSPDSPSDDHTVTAATVNHAAQEVLANKKPASTALPHAEVSATEFYKHISAEITEPRRMRFLLGWCGTRLLPAKPHPPTESTPAAMLEFQAQQAAHVIQEELSQSLLTNGTLSDWFSRDESVPAQIPLRKKANPRNMANAAKADELERELERLTAEKAEWDALTQSAASVTLEPDHDQQPTTEPGNVSPIHPELLDTPQRTIFEQLNAAPEDSPTTPRTIHDRLRRISDDLEFAIDQFAHGIHALSTTRDTADGVAERSLAEAATALEERERQRAKSVQAVDQMDALRGLARVLNSQRRG